MTTDCRMILKAFAALLGVAVASTVTAGAAPRPLDCPLRDTSFSIDSPLIDVVLKPEARDILRSELGESFDRLPSFYTRTSTPSFGAITTLRTVAGYMNAWGDRLSRINQRLATLPVTDADRIARCARYDDLPPEIARQTGGIRVLLFEKIVGFHHGASVDLARQTVQALAAENGWSVFVTDRGGVMTPELLRQFDVVVWNNVSGDVLTLRQRAAFRRYIERGGGFVGLHGSGGDPASFWPWYVDELLGQRFLGHPMQPQFQDGAIRIELREHPIAAGLPAQWTLNDEWYSFIENPRTRGASVLATLDESSYQPGAALAMGEDHPIIWTRCVGRGRSFYSAVGHQASVYADGNYRRLLGQAIEWAGNRKSKCGQ